MKSKDGGGRRRRGESARKAERGLATTLLTTCWASGSGEGRARLRRGAGWGHGELPKAGDAGRVT